MTAPCRGWCFTLEDGRRFAWTEGDGVRCEAEGRARLPRGARVVGVAVEEIVLLVEIGEN